MTSTTLHLLRPWTAALVLGAVAWLPSAAWSQAAVDMGQGVPDAKVIAEGLFPEDECEQLKAAGFKCMGFRPATRYALPATAFKVGSAEIPDSLKVQLEVFADVLRQRRGSGKQVRIEGHADASGSATANAALSQKRAESVRDFLVARGADPAMLSSVGLGSAVPKSGTDPFSPENRRVEIGRADAAK
ncbi:MAG TPA: OmpA family protein [Aquabacterium sp.]|nr:OmpA family protein [Aquabacterium sp.]HQC94849.1 OmpA family protein [Aquabacterium sp.]